MQQEYTLNKDAKDTIVQLKAARDKAANELSSYLKSHACMGEAPVKVGDTTEVTGYLHTGKQMKVHSVFLKEHRALGRKSELRWVALGTVLKKNGDLSCREAKSEYVITG